MGKSLIGAIQVLFRHYSGFFQKDLGDFFIKANYALVCKKTI